MAEVVWTPDDLVEWRRTRPGTYEARNGETRPGWSQEMAADWYGVSTRQWQRYEAGRSPIPVPLIKRMEAYEGSFSELVDRVFETPATLLHKWGSPFPELEHEDSEMRDITQPPDKGRRKVRPEDHTQEDDDAHD